MQEQAAVADGDLDEVVALLQGGDQALDLIRADVGAAHQVGGREAAETAEPRHRQGALLGVAISWPRMTSSWRMPARLMAARCPRCTSSTGWSWFCKDRTRTRSPRGCHSTSSPTFRLPEVTEPVTMVPCPWTMNERSIARRNHCRAERPSTFFAASAMAVFRIERLSPGWAVVRTRGTTA